MRPWKLGIFDWNGTLLDDLSVAYKALVAIFQHYNLPPPSLESYRQELDSENVMNFYYQNGFPRTTTLKELNLIWRPAMAANLHEARLAPHAELVLNQCRRLKLKTCIVSATEQYALQEQVAKFGIIDKFDLICGGAWNKEPILRELLEKCKTYPRETFYIDDTSDCLQAAMRVGIYTIGYANGYNTFEKIKAANPDQIVDSFFDVMQEIIESGF